MYFDFWYISFTNFRLTIQLELRADVYYFIILLCYFVVYVLHVAVIVLLCFAVALFIT